MNVGAKILNKIKSKVNSAAHLKESLTMMKWEMGPWWNPIIPGMQGWFNIHKCDITLIERKKIILKDTEKAFDKIQQPFIIKNL